MKKTETEQSEYEKANIEGWRAVMTKWQSAKYCRDNALALLDQMGGSSAFTDAKRTWDDDDIPF